MASFQKWILIVVYCSIGIYQSCADDNGTRLLQAINSKGLPDFVDYLEKGESLPWPHLTSDTFTTSAGAQGTTPSVLALALFEKLKAYEAATPRDPQNSLAATLLYCRLSNICKDKGGYINLCLADTLNRLAWDRTAQIIITDSGKVGYMQPAIDSTLKSASFPPAAFMAMVQEEGVKKQDSPVDLTSLDEKTMRTRIFSALGVDESYLMEQFMKGNMVTSKLIADRNVPVLFHRMSQTDAEAELELASLVDFYKKGGRLADINVADDRPFLAVMAGDETKFKSDLFHHSEVTTAMIDQMIKEVKNSGRSSPVGIALR